LASLILIKKLHLFKETVNQGRLKNPALYSKVKTRFRKRRRVAMTSRKLKNALLCGLFFLPLPVALSQEAFHPSLQSLLPQISGWTLSEKPQTFLPGTLFEYIDGAAEAYLSYDFKELVVAQYKGEKSKATLTLEVYDMGNDKNSFGIYSAERYSESHFIGVGNQGYVEEGTLNFIMDSYYMKLLCYDGEEKAEGVLRLFAQDIEKRIKEKGSLPPLLSRFPKEGLILNSEKFILRNVLGFSFLHDGYLASYKDKDLEFDLFIVEGRSEADAAGMLRQYLSAHLKNNQPPDEIPLGYHVKDRYAQNIYISKAGKIIFGVMRIKDGFERTGLRYLQALARSLEK
jgi:hypothetical protein